MFILAKEGEGFEVLIGMLKEKPDHWYISEKFAAVWLTDIQNVLMIPGDFTGYTEEDLDAILSKKIHEVLTEM